MYHPPSLEDYGLTEKQYRLIAFGGSSEECSWARVFIFVASIIIGFLSLYLWTFVFWDALVMLIPVSFGGILLAFLGGDLINKWRRYRLLHGPAGENYELYKLAQDEWQEKVRAQQEAAIAREQAEADRRRKAVSFWRTLKDVDLEWEVANLFRQMGYEVRTTPTSGDQGVDLFLKADGQTIVVQCKGLKDKASPSVVRDLYGAMRHFHADSAVLVCPTGFHRGVWEFAEGKPIELISASELVSMADGRGDKGIREEQYNIQEVPRCPRCRREMRLLSGRHDQFWSCTGYPRCIGTTKA